ncbi:MAG TPA: carbohydrate kinase [Trebonia sp.]
MIVVAGEALVDLVVSPGGQVDARPGGSPYNAARSLARLGVETTFLGRLARDGLGRLLRDRLAAEGVAIGVPEPSTRPSTLAVATLDQAGSADYAFYLDGTAGADLDYGALKRALPADATAVHVGDLGLVMEPVGAAIERLIRSDVPAGTLVLFDPNCRPSAVTDHEAYRRRVGVIARRADIVKASTEDLAYLYPDLPPEEAAQALLDGGPSLVLITDGPRPARAYLPDSVLTEEIPSVTVVDTIGAGDAFGGGFLAWWTAHGLGKADLTRPGPVRDAPARDAPARDAPACDASVRDAPTRRTVARGTLTDDASARGTLARDPSARGTLAHDAPTRDALVGQALRAAVGAAALTCTRPGADPPTLAELRSRNWWPEA